MFREILAISALMILHRDSEAQTIERSLSDQIGGTIIYEIRFRERENSCPFFCGPESSRSSDERSCPIKFPAVAIERTLQPRNEQLPEAVKLNAC